jgi:hypothetical protein
LHQHKTSIERRIFTCARILIEAKGDSHLHK